MIGEADTVSGLYNTEKEHREWHGVLHHRFCELLDDYIAVTGSLASKTSVKDLMIWSQKQAINPDHAP